MAASRREILKLYKSILRESEKFTTYNFRMYAIRKTKDAFKDNKTLTDVVKIAAAVKEAESSLQVIRRQAIISSMYQTDKLVIENPPM